MAPPARPPDPELAPPAAVPGEDAPSIYLPLLRQAITRRQTLEISYQAAEADAPGRRIVRPLLLEGHGARFYLRAYCHLRREERLFRVDRITAVRVLRGGLRRRGRPKRQEQPPAPPIAASRRPPRPTRPRASFFTPPPDPPPGSPLVRVWLAD
jgi:predicted DNA-binding transcriptional regulator YafY